MSDSPHLQRYPEELTLQARMHGREEIISVGMRLTSHKLTVTLPPSLLRDRCMTITFSSMDVSGPNGTLVCWRRQRVAKTGKVHLLRQPQAYRNIVSRFSWEDATQFFHAVRVHLTMHDHASFTLRMQGHRRPHRVHLASIDLFSIPS